MGACLMRSHEVPFLIEAKQVIIDEDVSSIDHIVELMD